MTKGPYDIETAQTWDGTPRVDYFKIIRHVPAVANGAAHSELVLGPFMFRRDEAEAIRDALNDAAKLSAPSCC